MKTPGPFDDVVNAIKKGDPATINSFLGDKVSIGIAGRSNTYSKAQAEIILKEFFSKNVVNSFTLTHQEETGGGSRYGIGNLETTGGSFRLSFFLEKKGDRSLLNEMKFESQ